MNAKIDGFTITAATHIPGCARCLGRYIYTITEPDGTPLGTAETVYPWPTGITDDPATHPSVSHYEMDLDVRDETGGLVETTAQDVYFAGVTLRERVRRSTP